MSRREPSPIALYYIRIEKTPDNLVKRQEFVREVEKRGWAMIIVVDDWTMLVVTWWNYVITMAIDNLACRTFPDRFTMDIYRVLRRNIMPF